MHQFEPIAYIAKDRTPLEDRWFWQICNRIDSVHRELTNWNLDKGIWDSTPKPKVPHMVFDLASIGDAQFWHDKYNTSGTFISDAAKTRIEAAVMTGVHFNYREQA